MEKDKDKLKKQVNDIITDLENLNTAEILKSDKTIKDYNSLIENVDSDPLSVIGSEIGQWKVIELLGQGGMSIVYLVERNDDQIQKQAALKIIPNTIASKTMIDRFLRERQILADLNHNNIAQLYDAGISINDIPWFVMELVQGKDILTYADSENLNSEQRIALFKQVCDALTYAHSRGVVHRDIKPNNLMVNEYGTIKLLDFGIAAAEENQSLTMTGAIIGTPGYMSPEQAKGLNNQMDKRTDIFSLGVLLYKLLKKEMPFKADSVSEISYRIIHDEPTLMGNTIATDLQAITFKCLEKKKSNRYQTVAQLSSDLNSYLSGDVISARKITAIGRLSKKVRKYPVLSSIFSVVLVITVLSIIYGVYQSISSLKKVQLAEKYTTKSQEIHSNVLRTHMMPLHDPNAEYEQYNQQIEELKIQIESDNAAESGQANYALGKAYQSMYKASLAHENFLIARNKGWDSIELITGLGETFSYKWQEALLKSKSMKDKIEKERFLEKAKKDYYEPAMHYLNLASQSTAEPHKLRAYIAYNEKNYPLAIENINKEIENNPWDFNALNMASQIHMLNFHKLSTENGYDTALPELVKSNQYLEKAIDIGRSFPVNYTSRCSNAGIEIQLKRFFDFGREMQSIFDSGMKYCKQALIMKPEALSPWTNMSYLYTNYARFLEKNLDDSNNLKILSIYEESIANANEGLKLHPKNEKMIGSKVQPFLSLAKYNQDDFLIAKGYYEQAINTAEQITSINNKSASVYISLGLSNATYANYLSGIEAENMGSLAEKHYIDAIEAFNKANQNGNDMMGQINLAGVYYSYAELKANQDNIKESIELLTHAFEIRQEHTPMRVSMFSHINNQIITITDLLNHMQSINKDSSVFKQQTIDFILKVCELKGLMEDHKIKISEFIKLSILNNWAQAKSYQSCQLK